MLGLALALLRGFALAVAIHLSPLLRRAVYPLAVGSQAVPIAVIGVLLVFWWGFGILPKLVVIALICFFPVLVTTVDGLAAVDPDQLKLLRTLDASRWQAFRFAELPAALPAAISGARIALAVGVIGAFIAETSTPTHRGLPGPRARDHHRRRRLPDRRARTRRTVVLFAFAIACFYALALAERRLAPWAPEQEERPVDASSHVPRRCSALPLAACLACASRCRACGTKQDAISAPASQAVHGDARLVPQRRPRAAVRGDRPRRLPRRRAWTCTGGPRRTGRTAEAARRRQGGHGDLL